ncbi:MAG: ABC transporter permease subunit, partial [Burkholderiales bacterium]
MPDSVLRIAQWLRHPILILAVALLIVPQLLLKLGFSWTLPTEIAIFAMVGLGYNLLLGYTGLLSFGHGLFFGMAAYGMALSQIHWFKGSLLLPFLCGLVFVTALGTVVGFLALRRRGVYFSMLTLAFTALGFYIVFHWSAVTGGASGLSGIHRDPLFGFGIEAPKRFYVAVALIVLIVASLLWRVVHSPLGSVLVAIRENEQRARFAGYPVQHYKLTAFVISAAVTGLGGCLYAYLKLFVSAGMVHPAVSGEILVMSVLGGAGNFLGPALGALAYLMFREIVSSYTDTWQLWFGLLFMGFILFSPRGLMSLAARLLAHWRKVEPAAMATRASPPVAHAVPSFLREHPPVVGSLVSCDLVEKRFGTFAALGGVNLFVGDRKLHALVGPNGAGKTTLFNVISGMYAPDHGAVRLAGTTVGGLPPDEATRRGLARTFQLSSLFPSLSAYEHLRLGVQARSQRRFHPLIRTRSLVDVESQTQELVDFLG